MVIRTLLVVGAVCALVSGCSTVDKITKKFTSEPDQSTNTQNLDSATARNGQVSVRLTGVGKATDGWLEYKVSVSNIGKEVIADMRAVAIDKEGREFQAATDPQMIQSPPKLADDMLLTTGVAAGGMALTMAGLPFIGPLLMGGVLLYQSSQFDDALTSDTQFIRSSMIGQTVHINEEKSGSFFLPAVRTEKLKVTYLAGNTRRFVVLSQGNIEPVMPLAEAKTETATPQPGESISTLDAQRKLKSLGYDPGPLDGKRGRKTSVAISQFQRSEGLPESGDLDSQTSKALRKGR